MSFYQNQDNARRKTTLLVGYFLIAVVMIVAMVNLCVFFTFYFSSASMPLKEWLVSPLCWALAFITLAVIGGGSLVRIAQLGKGGGISVAMMAGGTPIDPATQNPKERMLLNVVEEMAIASGTSIPRVFVMQEELGINAFVAGTLSQNTVLAVTKGALDKLNRDELQGVVGHEFSHILNGDMRLNLKLMGVLAGILLIGQLGEFLLRGSRRSAYRRSHYTRSSKHESQLVPLGLALMAIGYVGLFFGRLIKAAISRQREYLADASSVQFTRNPDGIASALFAIQHYSGHGLLNNRHAEDMSHMCFGTAVKHHLNGLLATHPPIEDRIRSIDKALWPKLKARFKDRSEPSELTNEAAPSSPPSKVYSANTMGFAGANTQAAHTINATCVKQSVGTPTLEHQLYAHELHNAIPEELKQLAHSPHAANLIYALLLQESSNPATLLEQLPLQSNQHLTALLPQFKQLDPRFRLPLLDMALATLKNQNSGTRKQAITNSVAIIKADKRITLSEFVYYYLIQLALGDQPRSEKTIKTFAPVETALSLLLCAIVQSSGESKAQQAKNFSNIMGYYSTKDFSAQLNEAPSANKLHKALNQISRLSPLLKQSVVDSCVDCVLHDNKAEIKEVELLRAMCEALECPMPPILIG